MNKLFVLLALIGFNPGVASGDQAITFACNYFPPQKITAPGESDYPGYDVEVLAVTIAEMNHVATFEFFPWNRAYEMAKTGQRDGLCSCSYVPEREEDFIFSDPIGTAVRGVFYREEDISDGIPVAALSDLRGKKVAVVRGYNLESELLDAGVEKIETANSDKLLLNLLMFRRVDFIYSYESTIQYELKQMQPAPPLQFKGLGEAPYYACFNKRLPNHAAFVTGFNDALKKIKQDGRYQAIMLRYRAP